MSISVFAFIFFITFSVCFRVQMLPVGFGARVNINKYRIVSHAVCVKLAMQKRSIIVPLMPLVSAVPVPASGIQLFRRNVSHSQLKNS